jgi:hypothetical protein
VSATGVGCVPCILAWFSHSDFRIPIMVGKFTGRGPFKHMDYELENFIAVRVCEAGLESVAWSTISNSLLRSGTCSDGGLPISLLHTGASFYDSRIYCELFHRAANRENANLLQVHEVVSFSTKRFIADL